MYSHACQPPSDRNEHEIGEMAIHRPIIARWPSRTSSNHAVRAFCRLLRHWLPDAISREGRLPSVKTVLWVRLPLADTRETRRKTPTAEARLTGSFISD